MLTVVEKHFKYHELTSEPKIFIDLDGTLSDFYRYFAHLNYLEMRKRKILVSDIAPDVYRRRLAIRKYMHSRIRNKHIDYWVKMPRTNNADYMWNRLRKFKPYVFTGVLDGDITMEKGKLKWCRRRGNLGFKNVDLHRLLINKNRVLYAMNGNCKNILIDDDYQNCIEWENAGGIAYYYVDHPFIVEKIVNDVISDLISINSIHL